MISAEPKSMQTQTRDRKGALLRIAEIYPSLQGEGLLTGTPSIFVRTSGCNLRCWFCDTPFASWHPEGPHLTVAAVFQAAMQFEPSHLVITGGEPMIFPGLIELTRLFRQAGKHITIETAGTIDLELDCDLISISPKLANSAPAAASGSWVASHHHRRERLGVVLELMKRHAYQLKFVVDNPSDAEEVLGYLEKLRDFDGQRVLLMPQGTNQTSLEKQAEWLIPWCRDHDLRYCPRAHIQWFGNKRAT